MTKNTHEKFDVKIGRSKQLNQLLNILHVCAFAACWLNDMPKEYKWLLSSLVVVLWAFSDLFNRSSPYFLRYTANAGWELSLDGIDYMEILILDGTVLTHYAILLYFKTNKPLGKSILIVRDSVSADDYRRFIVRLKLSRQVVDR